MLNFYLQRRFIVYMKSKYPRVIDGVVTREYRVWKNMFCRVNNYKNAYDTYNGVVVDERWLEYDKFFEDINHMKGWMEKDINGKYFQLDKDMSSILYGCNKMYSKETCFLIPSRLNSFFHDNRDKKINDDLPLGVCRNNKNKDLYDISIPKFKRRRNFKTVQEAQTIT